MPKATAGEQTNLLEGTSQSQRLTPDDPYRSADNL